MALTTPLSKVPPPVMRALLQAHAPVLPYSPYAFLLSGQEPPETLEDHRDWLRENNWLEPDQVTLSPAHKTLAEILARPSRRILIADTTVEKAKEKTRRMAFVSDGEQIVFAMFDRKNCLVSMPASFAPTLQKLLEAIGTPTQEDALPQPLRLDHRVLHLMGAMTAAGLSTRPSGPSLNGAGLSEARAERILAKILDDPLMGQALLVDLLADRLLLSEKNRVWIHPDFMPWHEYIKATSTLTIQQMSFCEDGTTQSEKLTFLGPRKQRCAMLPCADNTQEILLARLPQPELQDLLADVIGAPEGIEPSANEPTWEKSKFSFRG